MSISGDLPLLTPGNEYEITAIESISKYGICYKVKNIKNLTNNTFDSYSFLLSILTEKQATILYSEYPDVVDRVKENRLSDIDFSKLYGIKERTFSVIKSKIEENLPIAEFVSKFQGYISMSMAKKMYEKYTSIERLNEKLSTNPYKCLCEISRVGFLTADKLLLELDKVSKENIKNGKSPIILFESDLKSSLDRCIACIVYLLQVNEDKGNTRANLADIRSQVLKMASETIDHFAEAIKDSSIYYSKDDMSIGLQKTRQKEEFIAQNIIEAINASPHKWNVDVGKYKKTNDIELTEEQLLLLRAVCENQIVILQGFAGTGKSLSVQSLISMLEDMNKEFSLMAPTGKSAKVLAGYTHKKTSTIHKELGYNPKGIHCYYKGSDGESLKKIKYWSYDRYNKYKTDILIIDEFSMVDNELFYRVIDAVNLKETKLLLIGDPAQLPSVSCGNLLYDFIQSGKIPTITLTKIFRYNDGGLMKVATDVRMSKPYLKKNTKSPITVFGKDKDYVFIEKSDDEIPNYITSLYKQLLSCGTDVQNIQILTAKNVGVCGVNDLNNRIQKIANKNYGSTNKLNIGDTSYYVGDYVIQIINDYKATEYQTDSDVFIANGETGVIKAIKHDIAIINFNGVIVCYPKNKLTNINLAYAITIHKSQGSQCDNIIIASPTSHIFMLNSNLIYTGLTRMKKRCYHIGNYQYVNIAVKKKADLTRNTFMQNLLK